MSRVDDHYDSHEHDLDPVRTEFRFKVMLSKRERARSYCTLMHSTFGTMWQWMYFDCGEWSSDGDGWSITRDGDNGFAHMTRLTEDEAMHFITTGTEP